MGGINRPPTIQEAAEIPAPLARDFVYLLNRLKQLAASEAEFKQSIPKKFDETTLTWK